MNNYNDEQKALIEADKKWFSMSKSAEDFLAYTDPEFKFFPPNAPFMAKKETAQEFWRSIVETPGLTLTWSPEGAEASSTGDLGFTYGFYLLKALDDAGNETIDKGKYVTVMRKQKCGEWRPLNDIFNSDGE
ncbi:hypothetical protein A9Q74_02475 [Colwellia sp. 39_35_sub15_T18]|nr:hypothetical protein A9Q74_02475 [Colwellia sp. 39_35_sub15_T18]